MLDFDFLISLLDIVLFLYSNSSLLMRDCGLLYSGPGAVRDITVLPETFEGHSLLE